MEQMINLPERGGGNRDCRKKLIEGVLRGDLSKNRLSKNRHDKEKGASPVWHGCVRQIKFHRDANQFFVFPEDFF